MATTKGIAVCIGLNAVDPKHYQGWSGNLAACEADAGDMADIARSAGFAKPDTYLTKAATREKVRGAVTRAATAANAGDMVLLTYSGHGGQLPDRNGDEPDGKDETWCLYDGELVDDELFELFTKFRAGVRILVLSDSCHSGTVTRELVRDAALRSGTLRAAVPGAPPAVDPLAPRYRAMPDEVALATYRANRVMYDRLQTKTPSEDTSQHKLKATVRLISGCQDNQLSQDGTFNGLFTGTMLKVWNHGKFKGDYASFHKEIVKRMPREQTPNHYLIGPANTAYNGQRPFTVK